MSNLTIRMTDGREVTGVSVLADQRGYAKYARTNAELPAQDDALTFSHYIAWQFYKRQTGETPTFDEFCMNCAEIANDEDASDPTMTATPTAPPSP